MDAGTRRSQGVFAARWSLAGVVLAASCLVATPAFAGDATFTQPAGSPLAAGDTPFDVAIGDYNGDGDQDLATANIDQAAVTLALGGPGRASQQQHPLP